MGCSSSEELFYIPCSFVPRDCAVPRMPKSCRRLSSSRHRFPPGGRFHTPTVDVQALLGSFGRCQVHRAAAVLGNKGASEHKNSCGRATYPSRLCSVSWTRNMTASGRTRCTRRHLRLKFFRGVPFQRNRTRRRRTCGNRKIRICKLCAAPPGSAEW